MEREKRGTLRPNVGLYGEKKPSGESIGRTVQTDLREGLDLVVVIGTFLKVLGTRRLAAELCHVPKAHGGVKVWKNEEALPPAFSFNIDPQFWATAMEVVLFYLTKNLRTHPFWRLYGSCEISERPRRMLPGDLS